MHTNPNCSTNKRSYLSPANARNASILFGIKLNSRPLNVYRCPECNDWHLTRSHQRRAATTLMAA